MSNDHEFPIQTDGPRETPDGTPVIWVNPDVPDLEEVLEGDGVEFECPYPEHTCDQINLSIDQSLDDPRASFVEALEGNNGTLRCEDCDEPLYGLYGDGDH